MSIKLNLGCGDDRKEGWINLDILPYPNVDRVVDLTRGIPYRDVRFIYAEHFVEHLTPEESISLLAACRRALADDGVLRLSTPNLDWVLETHYPPNSKAAVHDCFLMNKAFHGWGHKFLFNRETLQAFLEAAGFAEIEFCAYGESATPELANLERHPRSPDTAAHPHVLIAEARGRRAPDPTLLTSERIGYRRDATMPFHVLQFSVLWLVRGLSKMKRALFGPRQAR